MAYVDQAKKQRIAAALKQVMPPGWKYSLAVQHHSTCVLTISSAPADILAALPCIGAAQYARINPYHYRRQLRDPELVQLFSRIVAALNTDNYDRSDLQTDYFDCGHYIEINIGRWDRPFKFTGADS